MKRIFIAIDLPARIKEQLVTIENKLKNLDAKSVGENIHLTLAFLGMIEEEKLKILTKELEKDLEGFQTFELHVIGIGVFPQPQRAHTLWIGLSESATLLSLEWIIRRKLSELKFRVERRPFVPHITIARFRKKQNITDEINKLNQIKLGSFKADRVIIYESILGTKAPIHKPVKIIRLGSKK